MHALYTQYSFHEIIISAKRNENTIRDIQFCVIEKKISLTQLKMENKYTNEQSRF